MSTKIPQYASFDDNPLASGRGGGAEAGCADCKEPVNLPLKRTGCIAA